MLGSHTKMLLCSPSTCSLVRSGLQLLTAFMGELRNSVEQGSHVANLCTADTVTGMLRSACIKSSATSGSIFKGRRTLSSS